MLGSLAHGRVASCCFHVNIMVTVWFQIRTVNLDPSLRDVECPPHPPKGEGENLGDGEILIKQKDSFDAQKLESLRKSNLQYISIKNLPVYVYPPGWFISKAGNTVKAVFTDCFTQYGQTYRSRICIWRQFYFDILRLWGSMDRKTAFNNPTERFQLNFNNMFIPNFKSSTSFSLYRAFEEYRSIRL